MDPLKRNNVDTHGTEKDLNLSPMCANLRMDSFHAHTNAYLASLTK